MYVAHLHFEIRKNIYIGYNQRGYASRPDRTTTLPARSSPPGANSREAAAALSVAVNTFNMEGKGTPPSDDSESTAQNKSDRPAAASAHTGAQEGRGVSGSTVSSICFDGLPRRAACYACLSVQIQNTLSIPDNLFSSREAAAIPSLVIESARAAGVRQISVAAFEGEDLLRQPPRQPTRFIG